MKLYDNLWNKQNFNLCSLGPLFSSTIEKRCISALGTVEFLNTLKFNYMVIFKYSKSINIAIIAAYATPLEIHTDNYRHCKTIALSIIRMPVGKTTLINYGLSS